jgi:hypothetical protein
VEDGADYESLEAGLMAGKRTLPNHAPVERVENAPPVFGPAVHKVSADEAEGTTK